MAYRDSDGNECSLFVLCKREPEWAANVIERLKADAEQDRVTIASLTAERDALRQGKWAGPWAFDEFGEYLQRMRPGSDVHVAEAALRGSGVMWRIGFSAGEQADSWESAKAAADAALRAAGWWLAETKEGE